MVTAWLAVLAAVCCCVDGQVSGACIHVVRWLRQNMTVAEQHCKQAATAWCVLPVVSLHCLQSTLC